MVKIFLVHNNGGEAANDMVEGDRDVVLGKEGEVLVSSPITCVVTVCHPLCLSTVPIGPARAGTASPVPGSLIGPQTISRRSTTWPDRKYHHLKHISCLPGISC